MASRSLVSNSLITKMGKSMSTLRSTSGSFPSRTRSVRHISAIAGPSCDRLRTAGTRLAHTATAEAQVLAPTAQPIFSSPTFMGAASNDDADVRELFDTTYTPRSGATTGLFAMGPLTSSDSLPRLTDRTLVHAQALVDRISNARADPSGRELRLVVKNLDRLSDLLCGVIDMCELVRNAHPDQQWVSEADRTYERLCSFMNGLNTDRGLYEALAATVAYPHLQPLSEAERQVAMTFLRDFEKSGISLPPGSRARFVELSDSLLTLSRSFLSAASSGPALYPAIEIPEPDRLLSGLGAQFVRSLPRQKGRALVAPGSWEAQMIARYAREGEARRLVYVGSQRTDPERVAVLEDMLQQRAELAGVLGKPTWADVALGDKMAQTPANVMGFLTSLAEHHRQSAANDVATLQRIKASSITGINYEVSESTAHLPPLYAWDRDFFTERYLQSLSPSSLPAIAPYFSTGTVLRGLSRLFSRLYGISFRPAPVAPGEVWHPSVRRLDVIDETEGPIGVIYCDLFSREGKPPSAAHYTVRCSRRVDDDDLAGDGLPDGWDRSWGPGIETTGVHVPGKDGRYQLPIVVLTTDFGTVEKGRPALLSWNDLETLFHEMGHAIHSMIGRTEYHNVSGTRCATDFVELPSILMEHFVSSPEVLSLFATHHATQEPLPLALLDAHVGLQQSLAALETHGQILMAMLDQQYHSLAPGESIDSTAIHTQLQLAVGVLPPVEGTSWQTQFGHLSGYGATYYSYLFDRAIAGKVWSTLFARDPLDRDMGEKLKRNVLQWGGGRDPWEMVGDVVGEEGEAIARGDERAMGLVGGWTIK